MNLMTRSMGIGSRLISQLEINGLLFHRRHGLRSGDTASDVFTRWQEVFRDNVRTVLDFYMFNYERTGQRQLFVIEFPSCQLNESPQTTVAGTGPIDQPLSFLALLNTANDSPIKMTIYTHTAYAE